MLTITRKPRLPAAVLTVLMCLAGCEGKVTNEVENARASEAPAAGIPLIVGPYTGAVDGDLSASRGLYTLAYDQTGSSLTQPELVAEVENPSYVVVNAPQRRLYSVSETQAGQVMAYQWDDSGEFKLISSVSSLGDYPCYIALSPDHSHLAVANYGTGNIAVYELDPETGAMMDEPQERQHTGSGPNSNRQEAPHAHWVQWSRDGRFIYAVDLGIDQVVGYPVNDSGELGEAFTALSTAPGAGPRHMVFHPRLDIAYILNELDNTMSVARVQEDGRLVAVQTLSTLPDDFSEHSQAAHIAISSDGETLYSSNRGHDSIAVFDVADDGQLSLMQLVNSGGDWPRHFSLIPSAASLFVANERSHNIVAFTVDDDGRLAMSGQQVQIAQPVYVGPLTAF